MWSGSNAHLFCPLDTAYVRVFVTDVNDNAPAFSQPVYEISVEEDKEVGFVVITVTANDEDEGNFFFSLRVGVSNILLGWSCHLSLVCVFCCLVLFVCAMISIWQPTDIFDRDGGGGVAKRNWAK